MRLRYWISRTGQERVYVNGHGQSARIWMGCPLIGGTKPDFNCAAWPGARLSEHISPRNIAQRALEQNGLSPESSWTEILLHTKRQAVRRTRRQRMGLRASNRIRWRQIVRGRAWLRFQWILCRLGRLIRNRDEA